MVDDPAVHATFGFFSFEGDDEVHGDGCFDGKFETECGFTGSLAECSGEARDDLIDRMGWNADCGKFDVRPC